jgi:hypothetical protein
MISLSLAKRLKEAGLVWQAGINDYFAIPDRDMDERVFVISDILSNLNILRGWPVVTFHGTAEWALDYILTTEVVWLPREEQLRQLLLESLSDKKIESLELAYAGDHYRCVFNWEDGKLHAEAHSAADAYGQVLLLRLQQKAEAQESY